jgi:hypothetical protein
MTVRAAVGAVALAGAVGACGGSVDSDGHPSGSDHAGGSHTKETGGTGYGGEAGSTEEPLVPPCPVWEGLEICGWESQEAQYLQTNFLLVVDRSASMLAPLPGQTRSKWQVMHEALGSLLEVLLNLQQTRDWCGLELFPSSASSEPIPLACGGPAARCCELPEHSEINIALGPDAQTIPLVIDALATTSPSGATPTARALARAHDYLTIGAGAAVEGNKYVLLATDGGPNCNETLGCDVSTCTLSLDPSEGCQNSDPDCCASTPGGCLDDQATAEQIARLASSGIGTIVIGVPDNELYTNTLEQLALSSSLQREGDTPYYDLSVEGESEALSDLFRPITNVDCSCAVPSEQLPTNPAAVQVAIDCSVIPPGEPDGEGDRWFFNNAEDPTAIVLGGSLCDRVCDYGVERIDVIFACPDSNW